MSKVKDKLKEDLYLFVKSHYYTTLTENGDDDQLCEDYENDTKEHVEELIQGDLTSLLNLIESMGYFDLIKACVAFSNISYSTEDENYPQVSKALEKAQTALSKTEGE